MLNFHQLAGAAALAIIFTLSIWAIYNPRVKDGLIGRVLYMAIAFLCLGGIAGIMHESVPRHIITWLLLALAALMCREIVRDHYGARLRAKWVIYTKCQRAKTKCGR